MCECMKEGNVLFNNTLNTFYLRLHGIEHIVKDHSDSESGNLLPPHGLLFPFSSKDSFICTNMKDRSDNPPHHKLMLLPRSYISFQVHECMYVCMDTWMDRYNDGNQILPNTRLEALYIKKFTIFFVSCSFTILKKKVFLVSAWWYFILFFDVCCLGV